MLQLLFRLLLCGDWWFDPEKGRRRRRHGLRFHPLVWCFALKERLIHG
jgi:hypothetical protein